MLVIRQHQLAALSEPFRRDFEMRAVAHLKRCLAEEAEGLDDSTLLRSVQTAIARAGKYGITHELAVLRYLNAMYLLGFDFDTDPKFDWAQTILQHPEFDEKTKMAMVNQMIDQHLTAE